MPTVTFFGATQEVTGSNHLIEDGDFRFMVDCGLHQGGQFADEKNQEPLPYDPKTLDAVFATHAHMDHIGRLPLLVNQGYHGPIYTTSATRDLAEILYEDAAEIMAEDYQRYGREPLYRPEDLPRTLARFVTVGYHEEIPLPGGWIGEFWDAGHILGSAVLQLRKGAEAIVFSGDLGNPPVPLLDKTESPDKVSFVVMESTYGDRHHENTATRESLLREAIIETVGRGGVLMIPSFALERTQELLYYINHLKESKMIPDIPVFLDSPLAIHATRIFENHPELWSEQARREFKADDFFNFPGLKMTATREESRAINGVAAPKIIIAGSGMMNGGRILHHAKRYLSDPNSQLLIIGYQANGTLGRRLLTGQKHVQIHGEQVFVRAKIKAIGAFSAHADQAQLLRWLKGMGQKPARIALVHGELDRMQGLASAIEHEFHIPVFEPRAGEKVTIFGPKEKS